MVKKMAFENLDKWWYWLILVISILLLTLVLYITVRLICGRKKLDGGYFLRLFLVSILLIVGIEALAGALTALTDIFTLSSMFMVFVTILFIIVIRYLITVPAVLPVSSSGEKYWQWSIWITLVSLFFLLAIALGVYYLSDALGDPIVLFTPI